MQEQRACAAEGCVRVGGDEAGLGAVCAMQCWGLLGAKPGSALALDR